MTTLPKHDVTQLLSVDANNKCAECDSDAVEHVSLAFGVFLCTECSSRHQQALGAQITEVRSLSNSAIEILQTKGNTRGKDVYEARVPLYAIRPPQDIGPLVIDDWICAKYEMRHYFDAHKRNTITEDMKIGSNENEQVSAELNFAVHKLPCAPLGAMVDCILPNGTKPNGTKSQFIVLHARWLARYAAPHATKCEQLIDISVEPVWITESSTDRCVLQIGISIHQRMQLQFADFAHIKVWTESLRRSAIFYHADGLGYHLSAIKSRDIEPVLSCTLADLHNASVIKHLKFASLHKSNSIFGWDKRWWCMHKKRKALLWFHKDPRALKIKGTFVDAQGGFYLNELVSDTDINGYRSAQKNCLLLYHFDRTLWLRFDDNLSLLSFWKELHVTPKTVKFIGDRASYYEKVVAQQNADIQIMAFKAGQKDVMSPLTSPQSAAMGSFFGDDMGDLNLGNDSSSNPASPQLQPRHISSEFLQMAEAMNIDSSELDSAILNHELLDMQSRMSILLVRAQSQSITADHPYYCGVSVF